MAAGHAAHAGVVGRLGKIGYIHQLNVKNEIRLGRNPRMGGIGAGMALGSVGQLPGDKQPALAANFHAVKAIVEAGNQAAEAKPSAVIAPPARALDRDEARFAQATRQMLETGDLVQIRYQDEARNKKPVGIYWLQAAAVHTAEALGVRDARTTIAVYRLPSLLGAIGAVLATYWCALAFVSRRGAVLAALMMAASALLGVEARLAKTDAMLLFTVVAAMAVLARAYLVPRETPLSLPVIRSSNTRRQIC